MDDKQLYIFKRQKHGVGSFSVSEHSFICSEDDPWDVVVLQFAAFLDQCGYVGVYENISIALEDKQEW